MTGDKDGLERSRRLRQDDCRYVWHPFTQMRDYERQDPLIIERGEGSYLIDVEGRAYLDGISSLWVTVHGHRREELNRALHEQIDRVAHSTLLGISNVPAIELARRLVEVAPAGLRRVFFSDSGATAVEIALKMAFQYWQLKGRPEKQRFLSFHNAYHGDTLGAVSAGGIPIFHGVFRPLLFECLRAMAPNCYRCPLQKTFPGCGLECLGEFEDILRRRHGEIAAVITEASIQAAAGMIVFPPGTLRRMADLCRRYDVLLIVDEVATGFGRTGKLFACEHEEVRPDLMAVAKGLTGGYLPLAATLATEEIYRAFLGEYHEFKTFFHGHTYTGNPLACAVALASLDLFARDNTLERLAAKIERLRSGLECFRRLPWVGDVRQFGFMAGIELVRDTATKEEFPAPEKVGARVIREARRRGVVLRPLGNVIVLMPPLSITPAELDLLLEVTYDSIRAILGGGE